MFIHSSLKETRDRYKLRKLIQWEFHDLANRYQEDMNCSLWIGGFFTLSGYSLAPSFVTR